MQFTFFSLVFLIIVIVLFYLIRFDARIYILFIASVIYPFFLSKLAGITILIFSGIVFLQGIIIYKYKETNAIRRILFFLFVGIIAIVLLVGRDLSRFVNQIYCGTDSSVRIFIPIGFSFYAFQAISYLVDIYCNKMEPMKNPIYFHLYMSWFPKFISGPIEKAGHFFKELSNITTVRLFTFKRLKKSILYILIGCFYKMVIADRLAIPATQAFISPEMYSWWILLLGVILYSLQIYCDFAGYSMFVVGISELFGIELTSNFNSPYFARNIKDFWNRWHISLSKWLLEYIYIPLGGNRKGIKRQYINVLFVFAISGIWHGLGGNFVIWGLLHGVYLMIDSFLENKKCLKVREGIRGRIIVLAEVMFAWIFFRANSTSEAIRYIILMLTNCNKEPLVNQLASIGIYLDYKRIIVFLFVLISFVIVEMIVYKIGLEKIIYKIPLSVFLLLIWMFIIAVSVLGIYGPDTSTTDLIYMNF